MGGVAVTRVETAPNLAVADVEENAEEGGEALVGEAELSEAVLNRRRTDRSTNVLRERFNNHTVPGEDFDAHFVVPGRDFALRGTMKRSIVSKGTNHLEISEAEATKSSGEGQGGAQEEVVVRAITRRAEIVPDLEHVGDFVTELRFKPVDSVLAFLRRLNTDHEAELRDYDCTEDGESVLVWKRSSEDKEGLEFRNIVNQREGNVLLTPNVGSENSNRFVCRNDTDRRRFRWVGVIGDVQELMLDFFRKSILAVDFTLLHVDSDEELGEFSADEFEGGEGDEGVLVENRNIVHVGEHFNALEAGIALQCTKDGVHEGAEEEWTKSRTLTYTALGEDDLRLVLVTEVEVGVVTVLEVEKVAEGLENFFLGQNMSEMMTAGSVEGIGCIDGETGVPVIDKFANLVNNLFSTTFCIDTVLAILDEVGGDGIVVALEKQARSDLHDGFTHGDGANLGAIVTGLHRLAERDERAFTKNVTNDVVGREIVVGDCIDDVSNTTSHQLTVAQVGDSCIQLYRS